MRPWKQIRIVSEGTGQDTQVQTTDGKPLHPVSLSIFMDAREVNRVNVEFVGGSTDITAVVDTTTLHCPICDHVCSHECNPSTQTLGGHTHD